MPNEPKIAHLLLGASDQVAGIQKYIMSIIRPKDLLIINTAPIFEKELKNKKIKYYRYKNIFGLIGLIKKNKIDILHCHLGQTLFPACTAKIFYPKLKLIYTQHFLKPAYTESTFFLLKNIFVRSCFCFFTRIIAISHAVKKQILSRRETPAKKIEVIYNGILLHIKPSQAKKITPTIVSICRLEKEKSPERIIAFAKAAPEFSFFIIGTGALLQRLKKEAPNNIKFLGFKEQILKELQKYCFFFFPSTNDGFGLALIEAMGCGLPLIALAGGAINELISGKEGLILTGPASFTKARSFVLNLCKNKKLYNAYRQNCLTKANSFSLEKMRNNIFNLYNKI